MEVLTFLLAIVVLILLSVALSRFGSLEEKLGHLGSDLRELRHELRNLRLSPPPAGPPAPVPGLDSPRSALSAEETEEAAAPDETPLPSQAILAENPTTPEEGAEPLYHGATPPPLPERPPLPKPGPVPLVEERKPGPFESSVREILAKIWNWIIVGEEHRPAGVTMEFAIATTWLIRLGVLILVIGIGFSLKYFIAKGAIGPQLRIALATGAGAGLVAWGLRLFPGRYRVLGQGLAGAGFATLYLSFFTAHQPNYGIVGPMTAFALMVLVTATAAIVAVRFNTLLVAVLGLLGGYGTPLLIRSGSESVVLLFSYILLLGLGMFAVASRKEWRLLHYLSFLATCALVGMAFDRSFTPERFWQFMPFLLGFFALFSSTTFVYQLVHRRTSTVLELVFLFLNAAAFTGFSVACIEATFRREAIALLTLGLAIFYILHIAFFLKKKIRDRGLLLSFTGLAAFFVAITLPLVLSKGWITVSWALQAFVMLWIASKMRSEFLRQLAYLLYLVVLVRFAVFDLDDQFRGLSTDFGAKEYFRHLVERLFVLGIPIGSFFAAGRLFSGDEEDGRPSLVGDGNDIRPWFGQSVLSRVCFWIVVGLAFVVLNLEVRHSFGTFYVPLVRPGLTLVWIALGALLLREMMTGRSTVATVLFWLLSVALVLKVFVFDLVFYDPGLDLAFAPRDFLPGLLMRALDFGAVAVFFLFVARILAGRTGFADTSRVFAYASLGAAFVYSSLEIWTGLTRFLPGFRMGGISIYWSLFAIALLLAGLLKNRAVLRGLGLFLLGGTILKVFFIDFAGLAEIYRIVAFILLGVAVLLGSFLYIKFSHRFTTLLAGEEAGGDDKPSEPGPP